MNQLDTLQIQSVKGISQKENETKTTTATKTATVASTTNSTSLNSIDGDSIGYGIRKKIVDIISTQHSQNTNTITNSNITTSTGINTRTTTNKYIQQHNHHHKPWLQVT
ncbi:hypothetical protein ACTFIR_007103 [Dictyostelium discoideum]